MFTKDKHYNETTKRYTINLYTYIINSISVPEVNKVHNIYFLSFINFFKETLSFQYYDEFIKTEFGFISNNFNFISDTEGIFNIDGNLITSNFTFDEKMISKMMKDIIDENISKFESLSIQEYITEQKHLNINIGDRLSINHLYRHLDFDAEIIDYINERTEVLKIMKTPYYKLYCTE